MYEVIKNVIKSKRYELVEMLEKIDTLWMQGTHGGITDEQRLELIALAQNNAVSENSINILSKLEELDKSFNALIKRVEALESASQNPDSGETEGGETEGEETVVTYPEYVAGKWYYRSDKVSFEGNDYICVAPEGAVCTWSPSEYPVYWELITFKADPEPETETEVPTE